MKSCEFVENLKKTNEYIILQQQFDSSDKLLLLPLNRNIENFEENSVIILVMEILIDGQKKLNYQRKKQ